MSRFGSRARRFCHWRAPRNRLSDVRLGSCSCRCHPISGNLARRARAPRNPHESLRIHGGLVDSLKSLPGIR